MRRKARSGVCCSIAFELAWMFVWLMPPVPAALAQAPTATQAQGAYTPTLTFDVISVRESHPEQGQPFFVGGEFTRDTSALSVRNDNIRNLLSMAYGVDWHRMINLPAWSDRAMYNIEAKADEAADNKLVSLPKGQRTLEQQHMMQALLAERFHLQAHFENREGPVVYLLVAKGGPKMQAGGSAPPSPAELARLGDQPVPELYQRGDGRRGYEFLGHRCHMTTLAHMLGSMLGAEAKDKTGLTGTYDFDLQYSQTSEERREADPSIWPDLPDAVQDQLGLRLQRAKDTTRTLVIDRLEPPTPN